MIRYDFRLEQKQKLIMTPELQQAIKLLQFSAVELADYVNQVMQENPLLEISDENKRTETETTDVGKEEIDWQEYIRESGHDDLTLQYLPLEEQEDFTLENVIPKETSLPEYLLFQLGCLHLNAQEQEIGRYLIGNIDAAGYLSVSTAEVARDLKVAEELVAMILRLIQSFDPPGVGARGLQECLLIQLKQKNIVDQALLKLVEHYLTDLGQGKITKVAAALNLSVARVQELADLLKQLNPKPGEVFGSGEKIRYIIPDVVIERVADEFVILVNDSLVPRLTINKTYSTILNSSTSFEADHETKNFVEKKMNQALWLIRSIEQRRMTIYRVTEALLKSKWLFSARE